MTNEYEHLADDAEHDSAPYPIALWFRDRQPDDPQLVSTLQRVQRNFSGLGRLDTLDGGTAMYVALGMEAAVIALGLLPERILVGAIPDQVAAKIRGRVGGVEVVSAFAADHAAR